jgi:hypothetical protein
VVSATNTLHPSYGEAKNGLPGGTRTPYHQLRRLVLYPDELRAAWDAIEITKQLLGTNDSAAQNKMG